MPEKILGLDIGTDSIKAVQIRTGLRGYEVVSSNLVKISGEEGLDKAFDELSRLQLFKDSICVTVLGSRHFFFRDITLPFKDKKKISQTIPYELESLIPRPADEVVIDYVIKSQSDQTEIFSAAVEISKIAGLLEQLKKYSIDASVIDIDAAAIAAKIMAAGDRETTCTTLLDIGAADTTLVVFDNRGIASIRRLPFGGNDITKAISENLNIDFSDAEEKKITGTDGITEEATFATLERFFSEVKNTLNFLEVKGSLKESPSRIFITGGGALFPPLLKKMETFFSIPVIAADISTSDEITFEKQSQGNWNPMLMNQALALATREAKKGAAFNFARGAFEPKRKYEKFRKDVKWVGITLAVIFFMLGLDLFIDYHYDKNRLNGLNRDITAVFKKTCPEVTKIVDPIQQLKVKIEEARNPASGSGSLGLKVLDLVKDISRLVPQSTDFLITSFTFDGTSIKIKGETDNFNTVDNIKNSLVKSEYFKDVNISSASLIKDGSRVGFDLGIEIKG